MVADRVVKESRKLSAIGSPRDGHSVTARGVPDNRNLVSPEAMQHVETMLSWSAKNVSSDSISDLGLPAVIKPCQLLAHSSRWAA